MYMYQLVKKFGGIGSWKEGLRRTEKQCIKVHSIPIGSALFCFSKSKTNNLFIGGQGQIENKNYLSNYFYISNGSAPLGRAKHKQ